MSFRSQRDKLFLICFLGEAYGFVVPLKEYSKNYHQTNPSHLKSLPKPLARSHSTSSQLPCRNIKTTQNNPNPLGLTKHDNTKNPLKKQTKDVSKPTQCLNPLENSLKTHWKTKKIIPKPNSNLSLLSRIWSLLPSDPAARRRCGVLDIGAGNANCAVLCAALLQLKVTQQFAWISWFCCGLYRMCFFF